MKRIMSMRHKMGMLLLAMLTGGYAFGQDDPSIYDTPPIKHDYLQFIGPGILFILIVYVSYRYWTDNIRDDKHTPHHP